MRLGQLARKLEIRPAEIVDYLKTKNVHLEEDVNARLEDERLVLITARFGPALPDAEATSASEVNEIEETTPVQHIVEKENIPESIPVESERTLQDRIDVIKAPKVELKGLKVIGKIELPEPKKKEIATTTTPASVHQEVLPSKDAKERKGKRIAPQKKRRNEGSFRKKTVVSQREREAREAEEKRRLEAIQLKEKRTQYYYNRVQAHVPTKAARIVDEPVEQISDHDLAENPKTWWGRFLRWLTT